MPARSAELGACGSSCHACPHGPQQEPRGPEPSLQAPDRAVPMRARAESPSRSLPGTGQRCGWAAISGHPCPAVLLPSDLPPSRKSLRCWGHFRDWVVMGSATDACSGYWLRSELLHPTSGVLRSAFSGAASYSPAGNAPLQPLSSAGLSRRANAAWPFLHPVHVVLLLHPTHLLLRAAESACCADPPLVSRRAGAGEAGSRGRQPAAGLRAQHPPSPAPLQQCSAPPKPTHTVRRKGFIGWLIWPSLCN